MPLDTGRGVRYTGVITMMTPNKAHIPTSKAIAALLALSITLPAPALALRAGLENQTPGKIAAGLEDQAPIRILFADQPQRDTVPGEIRQLIHSMGLDGQVALIEKMGESGNERKLEALIERYRPTIIVVFTGKRILVGPYVVHAASRHGVKLIIRAGAGYDNISVENTIRYGVPFLRSHGLGIAMADFTLRFMFAGLRLRAATPSDETAADVSQDPTLQSVFQVSPVDFHEALRQASARHRGEMTPDQAKLVFAPLSRREFLELARTLAGKRIGILGFGVIGQEVAKKLNEIKRLAGVPFEVVAASPSLSDPTSERARVARGLGVRIVDERELYQTSDIVTVHIPSTDANRRYITPHSFAGRTKPLILINTARGDLVDAALFEKKQPFAPTFFGDVDFDPHTVALRTAHARTFFITPHIGGLTPASAQGALDNLKHTLRTALPILLGDGDPTLIQTINGVQVTPIVSGPDLKRGNSTGLEELTQPPGAAADVIGEVARYVKGEKVVIIGSSVPNVIHKVAVALGQRGFGERLIALPVPLGTEEALLARLAALKWDVDIYAARDDDEARWYLEELKKNQVQAVGPFPIEMAPEDPEQFFGALLVGVLGVDENVFTQYRRAFFTQLFAAAGLEQSA